jgi:hypothetical protein
MFKVLLISSLMLASSLTFAGNLRCEITKDVVYRFACTQCVQKNGDNDCVREIKTTCSDTKSVSVVKANKSVGIEFFISGKTKEASFIFSQGPSGHSLKLSYVDGSESYYGSHSQFDIRESDIELSLKTKADVLPGKVTGLKLNCKAL